MESSAERCKRCGEGRMRSWDELNEEEREVVRRLPMSAGYSQEERRARNRWCTLCWHEAAAREERA
ncbi:MAG TPA: hypothetical protein VJS44_14190 [Pyrinomonadaceae bacterium]|nr:hypothetical protein [Pyrinomonadaceae bacterium]